MVQRQQEVADDPRQRPRTSTPSPPAWAAAAASAAVTRAASSCASSRAPYGGSTPEQVIERLRPQLNAIPGIRTYLQNPPLVRIGGQVTPQPVSVHLAGARHRRALPRRRRFRKAHARRARPYRRQQRPADLEPAGDRGYRPRPRVGARPYRRRNRERAQRCLRLAAGFEHLHVHQRLPGDPGTAAQIPARPERAQPAVCHARATASRSR